MRLRCGTPRDLVWFNESTPIAVLFHEARPSKRVSAASRSSSTSDEMIHAVVEDLLRNAASERESLDVLRLTYSLSELYPCSRRSSVRDATGELKRAMDLN